MATAQVDADKKQVGQLGEVDAGGFVHTRLGGISIYTGQGAPNHAAIKGSIYVDTAAANMYFCTAATGTWKLVTRAS